MTHTCCHRCGGGAMCSLPWLGWWWCGVLARCWWGDKWAGGVGVHGCLVIVGGCLSSINGGHGQLSLLLGSLS